MVNKKYWLKATALSLVVHLLVSLFVMINFMDFDKTETGPIAFALVFSILFIYSLVVSSFVGWVYSRYKNRKV